MLDALLTEAQRLGVRILTEHRVLGLEKSGEKFVLHTSQGPVTDNNANGALSFFIYPQTR